MIKLHQLKKHPKSTKRRKIVGRGLGSGSGTYAGRGNKGQKSRTGHTKLPARFEGGRQPLVRQLPKRRGFKSLAEKASAVKLSALSVFNDGDEVTLATLRAHGLIKTGTGRVKILQGTLSRKLTFKVPVSETAKATIEKAGGTIAK